MVLRPGHLLEQSIWKESYVGHVDASQHIPDDQIHNHLLFRDECDLGNLDKRCSLVFTPLEKSRPILLATAHQLPRIDRGHVERVRSVSYVPIAVKSLSGVSHWHPESSCGNIAG